MQDSPCSIQLPGLTFTRSLNGAAENTRLDTARLTLHSDARCDNFRDPNGKLSNATAPLLLAEVDNRRPFTLTARVTPAFRETYDAGALYLYVREDFWLKFAFERDERQRTRIVTVRTLGTSDDNNHDALAVPSVYLKIASDTRTVAFYHSLDGLTWQLARLFGNDYPASLWLGLSAQSPIGDGTSATFEDVSLTPCGVADFRLGV